MNISLTKTLLALGLFTALAGLSHAASFTLANNKATILGGNTTSSLYDVNAFGSESGTAAGLYASSLVGNAFSGFAVQISFGTNPQPILTSAFIKAGSSYLFWDATDLAGFNGGLFDSITLQQFGLLNPPRNAFLSISHAGLNGKVGTHKVPDSGATALLLGVSVAVLGLAARRLKAV